MIAGSRQIIMQPLDARLMRDSRERIWRAERRLGRVFTARAMNLIHLFGPRIIRLHFLVADGPGRRDAIVMFELAEVLLAKAVERRAVHLRGAANEVMNTRLERFPRLVIPGFFGNIAILKEDLFDVPVLLLALQPVAAFEYEDTLARRRQMARQRSTACTATDDNDIIFFRHGSPWK